jgi:K+-transporting ATPase KdpF subunit
LRPRLGDSMGTIIIGIIALLLFGYLLVAMIWPEKF